MRGTTPTHTFHVPIDLTGADVVYITYAQQETVKLEKSKQDLTITPTDITVALTQEDTLKFESGQILMQIRARFPNEKAVKSKIMFTSADKLLKEGAI